MQHRVPDTSRAGLLHGPGETGKHGEPVRTASRCAWWSWHRCWTEDEVITV